MTSADDGVLVHDERFDDGFFAVANTTARDHTIPPFARGILLEILSRPAGWRVTVTGMAKDNHCGRTAVQTAFTQLRTAGYMHRVVKRLADGRFQTDIHVFPRPRHCGLTGCGNCVTLPSAGSTDAGQPDCRSAHQHTEAPNTEAPKDEAQDQTRQGGDPPGTPPSTSASQPKPDHPGYRPDVDELCEYLADRINLHLHTRPKIAKTWRTACRIMIDIDRRSPDQIRAAIDFAMDDEFWRSNVLSMPTLRKQYDKLQAKARRVRWRQPVPVHPPSPPPEARDLFDEIDEVEPVLG